MRRFHFRFQNDYARQAFSYKIEKELLEPILRDIEKLKGEFLRIMGNPIGPDGQRRIITVIIRVRNASVHVVEATHGISLIELVVVGAAGARRAASWRGRARAFAEARGAPPKQAPPPRTNRAAEFRRDDPIPLVA